MKKVKGSKKKRKKLSLCPLKFNEALGAMIEVPPEEKTKRKHQKKNTKHSK